MNEPGMDELTEQVIGAAIEVQRVLGPGFLESSYGKALAIELRHRAIRFEQESPVSLSYRGESVGEGKLGFLVEGKLIIELKGLANFTPSTLHKLFHISKRPATDWAASPQFQCFGPERRH